LRDFQTEINNERIRSERGLRNLELQMQSQIDELTRITVTSANAAAAVNYLPNSHPEYSKLAFLTAGTFPNTAGDTNRECYNWYRQTSATTALAASAANALKRTFSGAEHSLWAANEGTDNDIPVWQGVSGLFLIGSQVTNWDIACLLPTDFVYPGQRFYVYCELALQTGASIPSGMQFYAGFWDNTAGQQKWIEGGDFTPTISVEGTAGTRTLEYKVLAATDSGEQILSVALSTAIAPNNLTTDNRVKLSFTGAPGFIQYTIYRKDGANYYKVGDIRNSIDLQFYDQIESGSTVVSEPGYPVITNNRPKAYAITQDFSPSELSTASFTPHTLTIQVPTTYNRSLTTGSNQWFRFGIDELVADSASRRGIAIRRLSVSEGYGGWARSNRDLSAASSPTSTATGAPVAGNPTIDPPPSGGGGISCVTLDTVIKTSNGEIPINDVERMTIIDNCLYRAKVIGTKTGEVAELVTVETDNGLSLTGSIWHRLIQSANDTVGISLHKLKESDSVLTCIDGKFENAIITQRVVKRGNFVVKSLQLPKPHLFITNGFVSHNNKPSLE
jgi:hypothetical protein